MDEESERKLEAELCWCVEQLRLNLESNRLTEKQAKDTLQAIKSLQNPKAPLAKKRQIMRSSFGDYRAKMEIEEKKFKLEAKVEQHSFPSKKSKFFRKSTTSLHADTQQSFAFNFSLDSSPLVVSAKREEDPNNPVAADTFLESAKVKVELMDDVQVRAVPQSEQSHRQRNSGFKFVPSTSAFKFDFPNTET